jgi:hypothetical protein
MRDNEIPADINDLPDPSLFGVSQGATRSKKERRGDDDSAPLSITSLMDALTIILVFLLKNFSSNPVQVKENKELKLPASIADAMPMDTTAVTITTRHIMVDDQPVVALENGKPPDAAISQAGMMLDPLFDKLQEAVSHQKKVATFNKKAEFKGELTIIADRGAPFDLIRKVTYTAGVAEFSKFRFAVIKYKD